MKNFELKEGETYVIYYAGNKDDPFGYSTTRQFSVVKLNWTKEKVSTLDYLGNFYMTFVLKQFNKNDILDFIDSFCGRILIKKDFEELKTECKEKGIDIIGI